MAESTAYSSVIILNIILPPIIENLNLKSISLFNVIFGQNSENDQNIAN